MMDFLNGMSTLPLVNNGRSRAITGENPRGERGAGGKEASNLGPSRKGRPCWPLLKAGETATLAEIEGTGVIQHIWMTAPGKTDDQNPFVLRDLILRMYWDGEETPSVECPLGDFFCLGFGQGYPVNSLPIAVNPNRGMNCYFAMPFHKSARITVENQNERDITALFYQFDYTLYDELPANTATFHAQWRRQKLTEKGKDAVILDGVEGQGQYVGTFLCLSALERYWWGEGEVKFYLDGDGEYPTICGTGTEDYFGGAWSFGSYPEGKCVETTYQTPFLGYPYYSVKDGTVENPYHDDSCPPMRSFYRFHVMDPVRFSENLKVTIQQIGVSHRGLFERQDDVATVAYWYQLEPHKAFPAFPERFDRWPR